MGSGVALLDYDNDGLRDMYFVNGAPIADPTPPRDDSEEEWTGVLEPIVPPEEGRDF